MCGILGIIAPTGEVINLNRQTLVAMRDTMQSRGPDDAGVFLQRNVALGHRRLSIRDSNGGTQPWFSDDNQCVLVYNGEIYNDAALRDELKTLGHHFRSHCDTETVMAAYREWGTGCVSHLCGMFAFGIYDFRDDRLFLARDRFGVKPLFLSQMEGNLAFASSIAALLSHPRMSAKPHMPVVSHYLTTFRITLGRETMYSGIWQLLPGEWLQMHEGRIHIERYWDYPTETNNSLKYDEAVAELETALTEAVESRLISDVPVGMFLSGGIDSNMIAHILHEVGSSGLVARCGGGGGEEDGQQNDFTHASRCAEQLGFDFAQVRVGPEEYFECWAEMLDEYKTPLSTPTDVILYRLAQEMKKSVGVVLGGEGADELLCGYAVQHWAGNDFDRAKELGDQNWAGSAMQTHRLRDSLIRQYGCDGFSSKLEHFFALNSLIPTQAKSMLFQPKAWQDSDEDRRMWSYYGAMLGDNSATSAADQHATILHHVNLEALLARLDTATMLAGLEARVPYTDHRLVEKMFRVPQRYKIDVAHGEKAPYLASADLQRRGSLRSKRILRSVAEKRMPRALAQRPKASFPTPVKSWLSGPWSSRIREKLLTSPFGQEIFERSAIEELAENIPQAGMWLWPIVNVCEWGDRQFSGC